MPRTANSTDFFVDVDRVGRFCFARRTVEDQFRIRGQYNHLTAGHYDSEGKMADIGALAYVTIKALLVSGPENFDIDGLDPLLEDDCDKKLVEIWGALREKELSFRPKPKTNGQVRGESASSDVPVVVPGQILPGTD